ncbi:TerB family tellurite resistance protein [Dysgonomonas reticulitermitis]
MGIFITGLLGGLIFALVSWAFSKIGSQSTKKAEEELKISFSSEILSIKEKTAIMYLLMKLAECDGKYNKKEHAVMQAIMNILGYNPNTKDAEKIGAELEKCSVTDLSGVLSNIDILQKEWFAKAIIVLMESDQQATQQENDFIQPILSSIGITNEKYNEIKSRLTNTNK